MVNLFSAVMETAERDASGSGREDEGYWRRAQRQLLRNAIELLGMARGRIAVPEIYQLVISAPTSRNESQSEAWRGSSFCFSCLVEAESRTTSGMREADLALVADYFLVEYPSLSEKTRSVVVSTLTALIDVMNRGVLRELFCTTTTVTPEIVQEGRILLIDLPIKQFGEVGLIAQALWKQSWQRSIERRDISKSTRPVFYWADEAQYFVTSTDALFHTTCRSARVASVLLTQSVSNFYAALGSGEKGKSEADALLTNLNTKIFHGNSDPVTNEWASTIIGKTRQYMANGNTSQTAEEQISSLLGMAGFGGRGSASSGFSESYEFEVQPREFSTLRAGGPACGWQVDGIVFSNGGRFAQTGRNWMKTSFPQR